MLTPVPARLPRLPGWQSRLAAIMAERRHAPFAWGAHDCALFAADCVQALTGQDLAAAWRGRYADAMGAARLLSVRAGAAQALRDVPSRWLPGASVRCLRTGDLCLLDVGGRDSLAVVNGGLAVGPGPSGLAVAPLSAAVAGWRVG